MASGTFGSSTGVNLNLYCEWSATTNTAGNYSTVTMKTYLTHYSLVAGSRSDSYVKCDGQNYTYTAPAINWSGKSHTTVLLNSKSFKVNHNSDGKKTITLSAAWRLAGSYGGKSISWLTISKSVALDNIPRAALIGSAPNFTSDQNPTIQFSNPGGYTINALLQFGSETITRKNISNTGSYTFSFTSSEKNLLFSKCKNSSTMAVRFVLETELSSTSKDWTYLDRTMTVQDGNPTFTSVTASRVDNGVPGAWGIYVKGKSKCTLTINGAAGVYGSTISGYSISGGGFSTTASSFTTGVLNSSGTITFTAKITDSRGRTASKTCSISVSDYTPPVISGVSSKRCDSSGSEQDDGTYAICKASYSISLSSLNTCTHKVYYKAQSESSWTYGGVFSAAAITIGNDSLNIDAIYQVKYEIVDAFTTVIYIDQISTAFSFCDVDGANKSIGIGQTASGSNNVAVNLEASFKQPITIQSLSGLLKASSGAVSAATKDTDYAGAILYGSNTNGEYVKFPDGTLICTKTIAIYPTGSGSDYTGNMAWTFPCAFTRIDFCIPAPASGDPKNVRMTASNLSTTGCTIYLYRNTSNGTGGTAFAVGRWKA